MILAGSRGGNKTHLLAALAYQEALRAAERTDMTQDTNEAATPATGHRGKRGGNKYGAKRTEYGGRTFDSKFEASVAKALIEGGYGVLSLQFQQPFRFTCGVTYRADFVAAVERNGHTKLVVIEAKGKETDAWRIKEKLFRHEYGDQYTLLVVKRLSDLEALRDLA